MNFLEKLASEWFSYTGYFVRNNIQMRKRKKGGYDNEIDLLAFNIASRELIHLESSGDANSWESRKKRFTEKKFIFSKREYESLIGEKISVLRKIALVSYSRSTTVNLNWGNGIEVILIPKFLEKITDYLQSDEFSTMIIPEGYPLLRAMQVALAFQKGT